MTNDSISRREALRGGAIFAASAASVVLLGCGKKELACTDTKNLSAPEQQARTALAYVDRTPDPAKPCESCQFYVAAAPDSCGSCSLVKGPINPRGYCSAWAQKLR